MMDNVCPICLPAAAGTELTGTSSIFYVIIVHIKTTLHLTISQASSPLQDCWVKLSFIAQDSTLLPSVEVWTVLISNVAVHAPTSTKGLRFGRLLPHQLNSSDLILIHLLAKFIFYFIYNITITLKKLYLVLIGRYQ